MTTESIHVMPDDSFYWVVQDDGGKFVDHFPTQEAAERFAQPLARTFGSDLVIHRPDGRMSRQSFTTW